MRSDGQLPISDGRLPIQSRPTQARPMQRHHTARYYAHRVKESLTTRVSKLICAIFLFLLFLLGIITFILWLSLRPHRPRFHVQEFSIPGFDQANARIDFNVTARNSNQNVGFYYDAIQVTVNYQKQNIGGTTVLSPFYQGPKNTQIIAGTLSGATLKVTPDQWQRFAADRTRGPVVFDVDLESGIRFKISSWQSKWHKVHATCTVGVGSDGVMLPSYRAIKCPVYFT